MSRGAQPNARALRVLSDRYAEELPSLVATAEAARRHSDEVRATGVDRDEKREAWSAALAREADCAWCDRAVLDLVTWADRLEQERLRPGLDLDSGAEHDPQEP